MGEDTEDELDAMIELNVFGDLFLQWANEAHTEQEANDRAIQAHIAMWAMPSAVRLH